MPTPPTIRLIGLPTDCNSSFQRGPAKAPAPIREALLSDRGNAASEIGLDLGRDILLDDAGDLPLTEHSESDDQLIHAAAFAAASNDIIPIFLGGDHAVTYPVIEGLAAHHGPVSILHIDAHPDIYDDFEGNPRSHASPFARIMERKLAVRLVQVGIRTANYHCREQAARFGIETFGPLGFTPDAVPTLAGPLYISIDMDGIDPAHAPGVSHPEPGGLTVRETLAVLFKQTAPIVGADVVEYNPDNDPTGVTAILAAKLVKELAAIITRNAEQLGEAP